MFNKLEMSEDKKENKGAPKKKSFLDPKKPDGDFDWSKVIKSVLS